MKRDPLFLTAALHARGVQGMGVPGGGGNGTRTWINLQVSNGPQIRIASKSASMETKRDGGKAVREGQSHRSRNPREAGVASEP